MTYFGLLGLLKYSENVIVNILYGFLVSNGFYSALNHWHGIEGWAYADSLTMILPVSIININNKFIYRISQNRS